MASATYGAKIMKDLGLIPEGYKIMVVGSVQEEDCDGMCWQSIVNEYFNGPEDARDQDRVRHLHRAHRRRHLPRSPRPHGDPRGYARRLLPRLRARARRQRHPQDGRGPAQRPRPQRERRRRLQGDQGPREDARSRSTTPSTGRMPASWAAAPAPPARSSTPLPPAAPWPTPAPSPSTAA